MERKGLDSRGKRGKVEIPQAQPRKLDFLPAGKQVPAAERNDPSRLFFMSSSGGLPLEVISQSPQKGTERLSGAFALCLSPQNEPLPLFYCPAPAG
ncbi:hypothetical protein ASG66_08520 [Bacillus sp. Leaf406]|nr:hypothetical protein ASG66_08520 [Bacillus sp. Leaf406]